ncbi:membrane protein [Pseudoalteromonas lipolytica SCSIO 04301]|uniref:MAPEG family protein n=1 Tax=Pseudoalteromonas lipolytica TaxID=570156 RepID=UPI00044BA529|nr:MAPEG family protein [Pseudoalteromonas lipolytica]EWH04110.1 membrane protein [Pseudoalteromonas lipolytica SCSIO 04301]
MTTLILCALIAVLLPYLAKAPVAFAQNKLAGYDNKHPREQQSKLTGFGARALAAHQNSFESLIIFGVALAVVMSTNNVYHVTETLAVMHVVSRVMYCIFYYINQDILRSLVWLVGYVCAVAMIAVCL